jgi:hypothetical protein
VAHRTTLSVAPDVEVEFRWRGGVDVEPRNFTVTTDGGGRFPLRPVPADTGEVVFDLVVRPPAPLSERTFSNQRMYARAEANPEPYFGTFWIGPHLPYLGIVLWGDTGQGAVGVPVQVRRLSGIAVTPNQYNTTTSPDATFLLGPRASASGTVELQVTFRPPAPYRVVVDTISLNTTEGDEAGVLARTWMLPRR